MLRECLRMPTSPMPRAMNAPAPTPLPAEAAPVGLLGCQMCDAPNRIEPGAADELVCWRCGSPLPERGAASRVDAAQRLSIALALLLAGAVALIVAHALPMVGLELQGQRNGVTLAKASFALWQEERAALAVALFVTTVLAPAVESAAMLLTVHGLAARLRGENGGVPPPWLVHAVHLWQTMKGWNMTEIMVLGAAVALVKLGQLATLIIGPALVALMAFMVLRLAAMRFVSPPQAWALIEARRT